MTLTGASMPVQRSTWLLWFGPGVLLVAAGFAVVRMARRRAGRLPADANGAIGVEDRVPRSGDA